jgi:hypothetical protein
MPIRHRYPHGPVSFAFVLSPTAARTAIILAGCLSMAYTQLSMSPATIELARSLGGTGFHVGLLGALPAATVAAQFLAALAANRLQYRKPLWMPVAILERLMLVPLAVGPWLVPDEVQLPWIWIMIALTAANHALLHFCTPLWLSWMGDYLPQQGLSEFWGVRQLWMQWTAAVSLLLGAVFVSHSGLETRTAVGLLLLAGAVLGVADILIFTRVDEPPVKPCGNPRWRELFSAPFRQREFRSFITFACFWHFAAMIGAPFISLYLLTRVRMNLDQVMLLWTFSWVGGAVLARRLGRLVEMFGNRPLLILCTGFKATNMAALLAVGPETPWVFWILVPAFMFDALLNSGIAIATNGFLLKNSPAENRTMYIAAGTAIAGMTGGVTSVLSGTALAAMQTSPVVWHGRPIDGFHVLFLVSFVLRLASVWLAWRVREPRSRGTIHVVTQLIGVTPLRILRFPLGLYRSSENQPICDDPSPITDSCGGDVPARAA